jgi:hypothetical protein
VPNHLKELAPRAYAVELVSGRLDVDIDTAKKPIFGVIVRAPRGVAAFSTGGRSTIIVSPTRVVLAALAGKELSGSALEKWRSLHVGTALVVSRDNPAGQVHELLPPPLAQAEHALKFTLGSSAPTKLSWSSVPDAQSYEISLSRETLDGSIPVACFDAKQTYFDLPPLEPGQYTATVAATDRWLIDSLPSNTVAIRVIEIKLPEGAYVYNGVAQLGREQQIHFSQVDGLEMAFGSGTLFRPATESLGLSTGHPLLTRFRQRGSNDEVTLKLEPRAIASTVQFEPQQAQWPGQALNVEVRIFGPNGADLPESIDVAMHTSVNAKAIDVNWDHEGNVWRAKIKQPPIAGPWIVRVTANDQVGQVLARDFIEVALSGKPQQRSRLPQYISRY